MSLLSLPDVGYYKWMHGRPDGFGSVAVSDWGGKEMAYCDPDYDILRLFHTVESPGMNTVLHILLSGSRMLLEIVLYCFRMPENCHFNNERKGVCKKV